MANDPLARAGPGREARTAPRAAARRPRAGPPTRSRTPLRSSRRVKRRSWRTKSPEGCPVLSASGRGRRGQAVEPDRPGARRELFAGQSGAAPRTSSAEPADRFSEPLGHVAAAARRHQPGAVVGVAGAAAGVGVHGHRERQAAVQPLATATQRDERVQLPGRAPARPPRACAGARRSCPTTTAPSRASGSTSCPRARSASSSHSRSSASPAGESASSSTTSGAMPAACVAPRSACPTGRSLLP